MPSGFYYCDGREMPLTHPDHGPMADIPRQEDGSIHAYYYCSKQEWEDWGFEPEPPPRRSRHDGWDVKSQKVFIETLAATASVTDAAKAAGESRTSAYALRNRADAAAFRAAWDKALRVSVSALAGTAFDRAVNGVEEPVYHKGGHVGHRRRYDNKLLMFLLRVRDPLNYAPLDDLQGWLRHRDVEPQGALEKPVERLIAAEAEWGRRVDPASRGAVTLGADPTVQAAPAALGEERTGALPSPDTPS